MAGQHMQISTSTHSRAAIAHVSNLEILSHMQHLLAERTTRAQFELIRIPALPNLICVRECTKLPWLMENISFETWSDVQLVPEFNLFQRMLRLR